MKSFIITTVFLLIGFLCFPQKPIINLQAATNWEELSSDYGISANGRYIFFRGEKKSKVITIKALNGTWSTEVICSTGKFSSDGQKWYFLQGGIWSELILGTGKVIKISDEIGQILQIDNRDWFYYFSKNRVYVKSLSNDYSESFDNIVYSKLSHNGNSIIMIKKDQSAPGQTIIWLSLSNFRKQLIEINNNNKIKGFEISPSGNLLGFIEYNTDQNSCGAMDGNIYVFNKIVKRLGILKRGLKIGILEIEDIKRFSRDDKIAFLNLKRKITDSIISITSRPSFSLWSYLDVRLLPEQILDPTLYDFNLEASIELKSKRIFQLQKDNEYISVLESDYIRHVTSSAGLGNNAEAYWNRKVKSLSVESNLINVRSGEYQSFNNTWQYLLQNPSGRHLVFYDTKSEEHFVFDRLTHNYSSLNSLIGLNVMKDSLLTAAKPFVRPLIVLGFRSLSKLWVSDKYDLWEIDLFNKVKPVCLTNGYGKRHQITFRLIANLSKMEGMLTGSKLVLSAYDNVTHDNGFFSCDIRVPSDPFKLSMEKAIFYMPDLFLGVPPIKAKHAKVWLVERQSTSESINLFWTSDFKTFNRLTHIQPESEYLWMTSELVSFKKSDGKTGQAAVYKPSNFDTTKKYPVIFYFYENLVYKINQYQYPSLSMGTMNIPWFVSRGYIVCTPDIEYKMGHTGASALKSVVGAAEYLQGKSWVNKNKIGLYGHSHGAYQTNFIVSHSDIFSAACSAAGLSDLISNYNSIRSNFGVSAQYMAEIDQLRIGASLWERPDLYIENSPIFSAYKVNTPLLMMHSEKDGSVPFEQSLEFFLALRRLGKRSWLLSYDNENHALFGSIDNQLDYTIRINQFFDHYLKDLEAPKWMTRGIPASMKGIDSGLELDKEIRTPSAGLLNDAAQRKVDSLQNRKPITITLN